MKIEADKVKRRYKSDGNLNNFISSTTLSNNKTSMASNYLDYTFLSRRNCLSFQKKIDGIKPKDYLYDLMKTNELNMEIIKNTIDFSYDNDKKLIIKNLYNNMIKSYERKKQLVKKISEEKSKILINRQIEEELIRKREENYDYYNDNISGLQENLESKIEYIKLIQKRLKEVEIYIHKNVKDLVDSPYIKFHSFKMNNFLEENTSLLKKNDIYKKDKIDIQKNIDNLKKENIGINNNNNEDNYNSNFKEIEQKKINEYINKFKNQIKIVTMRMKLLKNYFDNLNYTLVSLHIDKKVFSELHIDTNRIEKHLKIIHEEEDEKDNENEEKLGSNNNNLKSPANNILNNNYKENNQSILPLDLTRKLNNYMDFSFVLNKKIMEESKYDDLGKTAYGKEMGDVTNINMWDISRINKN